MWTCSAEIEILKIRWICVVKCSVCELYEEDQNVRETHQINKGWSYLFISKR